MLRIVISPCMIAAPGTILCRHPRYRRRSASVRENLPAMIASQAERLGDHTAMRCQVGSGWRDISYRVFDESVQTVARGLLARGLEPGDRVGIMSWNRAAWSIADLGILRAGGVVVPIYPTSTPGQVAHILRDADVEVLFVGGLQELACVRQAWGEYPELQTVVVFDDEVAADAPDIDGFAAWMARADEAAGQDGEIAARQDAIRPDDLATIIYTSGTTGEPKGVMLSHANIFHQFRGVNERFEVGPDDRSLCFLPLSHTFERTWTYYVFHQGATTSYLQNPKHVIPALSEIRPTVMTGVPRLYEKIHAALLDKLERGPSYRRRMFQWARRVGLRYHTQRLAGQRPSPLLRVQHLVADLLVMHKLRDVIGGPKKFLAAGGAALSKDIEETFLAAGVLICQGYGLTETSPMLTCNCHDAFRLGTVGRPVCEVDIRVGEDGELQVRGPNVMQGYWRRPAETAAMFTDDGWLRTGDVGEVDPDGYVRVTDRIKDLIVTSSGKNIAPAAIEMMVGRDHYIEQVAVVGDGQKFLGALVIPSYEALESWAQEQRIRFTDRAELLAHHRVVEFIRERIQRQMSGLASFERIKRFHLLENGFSLNRGEITPTLKLKRKVIAEHYREIIDRLFHTGAKI
ncbi:AMP-binding protein [bacterium]|nr:AMP-binding protein [bacterium]